MSKPKYQIGDRCPECGSKDIVYERKVQTDVCCSCGFNFAFDEDDWNHNFFPAWDKEPIEIDCDGNEIIY
ncbi:MAG: hypothetical protein QNJ72_28905 [Pleurocapsa sp. MO_226.B13]|nr:hypothetical protein [Pleurocapsa sp. MO_226.B13]